MKACKAQSGCLRDPNVPILHRHYFGNVYNYSLRISFMSVFLFLKKVFVNEAWKQAPSSVTSLISWRVVGGTFGSLGG